MNQLVAGAPLVVSPDQADPPRVAAFHSDQLVSFLILVCDFKNLRKR
ncbi:hypothetical protein [Sporosarcina sp. P20a]|nr:hypothetical protein [Sporosarcina sp. P20a]